MKQIKNIDVKGSCDETGNRFYKIQSNTKYDNSC